MKILPADIHHYKKFLLKSVLVFTIFFTLAIITPHIGLAAGTVYYVSPDGDDVNNGLLIDKSLKTIQRAVDIAEAGDTIQLAAGEYREDVVSRKPEGNLTAAGIYCFHG